MGKTYPAGGDNHHDTGSRANVGLHDKPGIHIPWGDWRVTETVTTCGYGAVAVTEPWGVSWDVSVVRARRSRTRGEKNETVV